MGYRVQLAVSTIDDSELNEVVKCLKSGRLTMGERVREFERMFAEYLEVKHAAMINSGSSANLLAMSALSNFMLGHPIKPGDEVIVPAVAWSTTVFPVLQIGAVPVFVDCDSDYVMDENKVEELITEKTKAIIPTHILGNVCNMDAINKLAKEHELYVIEDTCESLGSQCGDKKAGTLGDLGTFSFYFSHHITTIEGGMIVTNSDDYADIVRVMRHHGLVRDSLKREEYIRKYPEIDPRFMFINTGFNLRPTELNGVLGISQLRKLGGFLERRRKNSDAVLKGLREYKDYLVLPREKPGTSHSWFAFPLTVKPNDKFKREDIMGFLEKSGIETRPLIAGNLVEHPVFLSGRIPFRRGDLSMAENVMRNSFYLGMHPEIDVDYINETFRKFFSTI